MGEANSINGRNIAVSQSRPPHQDNPWFHISIPSGSWGERALSETEAILLPDKIDDALNQARATT